MKKNSIVPATHLRESPVGSVEPTDIAPLELVAPPGAAEDADESGAGSAKLRRYWAAVKRFKWIIVGVTAAGTIAGVVATRFVKDVFEARGAMWIADVGTGGGGGNAYRPPELLPNGSWVQLIRSFAVVDEVVANQHLFVKPRGWQDSLALDGLMPTRRTIAGDYTLWVDSAKGRFSLFEAQRGPVDRGALGDSVGRPVGFAWVPTLASLHGQNQIHFTVLQPRAVSVDLIKRLDVGMQENSNFLTLTLTGPDKWQTADLLNAWMQQFVATAADLRRRSLTSQASILENQMGAAATGLRDAESSLQAFRTQAITKPSENTIVPGASAAAAAAAMGGGGFVTPPQDALATEYFQVQSAYAGTKRAREMLEAMIPQARAGNFAPDVLMAVPSIANAPALSAALKELVDKEAQLRAARQQYTDSFPAVRRLTQSVTDLRTKTIPDLLATQVNMLHQQESRLALQAAGDSASLQGIPARTTEEARLRREEALAEQLYNSVLTRYQTAKLGAESTVPDVSVLDPALPAANAQRDTKVMLVLGGFGGALAFGVVIALLLDIIDHRFRYQEQIADELKLETLGAIPTVPKPGDANQDPEAVLQSVEAFRSLRMHLHHAFDNPPVMLTISSPGVGDGKSMIASNLALSFAEAGFRTLLIDGDIRRGKLHTIFGLERRPGLLDYLAGDVDAMRVMREVPVHGALTLIPSGTRRHRGPELLTSARLPALLNMVRSKFDVIIIDSAPLAAGVDAYALSVATRNMLLVMRTGHTDRRVAKAKLKLLQRLPVRVLGAVVNAVTSSEIYTEYSYLYGYGPDADSDSVVGDEIVALPPGAEVATADQTG